MDTESNLFQPIETKRASEAIYDQIKGLIVSGKLRPGDRLPSERNMMEQLKRSRPTIREALRMLEREGFIRTSGGTSGAVVQKMGTGNVEQSLETILKMNVVTLAELSEYRSFNDLAIAELAAERRTDEDLEALEGVLAQAQGMLDRPYEFILLDPEYHGLLARAAKNEVAYIMTQLLAKMNLEIMRERLDAMEASDQLAMCGRIYEMHKTIFGHVREKNPKEARQAMSEHLHAFRFDAPM